MNNEIFSAIFSELSKEIKNLDEASLNRVVNGQAKLKLQVIEKTQKQSQTTQSDIDIKEIALKLNAMTSNDEGMAFLKERCKRKVDLQILAQHLEIPFRERDAIAQLTDKIIDSTIAYRTRAAAIQKQK